MTWLCFDPVKEGFPVPRAKIILNIMMLIENCLCCWIYRCALEFAWGHHSATSPA